MATGRNNAGNFARFSFGLDRSRPVVSKRGNAYNANHLGELLVTITFEGSHIEGLILTLANASNKEVKS